MARKVRLHFTLVEDDANKLREIATAAGVSSGTMAARIVSANVRIAAAMADELNKTFPSTEAAAPPLIPCVECASPTVITCIGCDGALCINCIEDREHDCPMADGKQRAS